MKGQPSRPVREGGVGKVPPERAVTRWLPTSSLRELPGYYRQLKAPPGKTDVVVITDAVLRVPPDVARAFLMWKAEAKARLISLVVGGAPGDLAQLSDEAHTVRALDTAEEGVARALSL